jgi:preprotein translocase YajC subunit
MNTFAQFLVASPKAMLAATKTTTATKTSTGGSEVFLVIIVLFAVFYFMVLRPNQRRRMQAVRQSRAYDLGDEVVAGGMVGRVVRIGDGEVDIEVSDGVVVQFVPHAVQLRSAYNAGPAGRGLGGRQGALGTRSNNGGGNADNVDDRQPDDGEPDDGQSDAWPEATATSGSEDGYGTGGPAGHTGGAGSAGGIVPDGEDR